MAGKGIHFEVKSKGVGLENLLLRVRKEVKDSYVKVGVFGAAKHQGASDKFVVGMVELAAIHEFGAPRAHIPARSFLWSNLYANSKAYKALVGELLSKVYEGRLTVERALNVLGMRVANDAKGRISRGEIKQDLAPSTLERKLAKGRPGSSGSPKALIETGRLKESITWQVFAGGKEAPK